MYCSYSLCFYIFMVWWSITLAIAWKVLLNKISLHFYLSFYSLLRCQFWYYKTCKKLRFSKVFDGSKCVGCLWKIIFFNLFLNYKQDHLIFFSISLTPRNSKIAQKWSLSQEQIKSPLKKWNFPFSIFSAHSLFYKH